MKKIKKITGNKVSFINLNRQYLKIQKKIDRSVKRVLLSGQYLLGKELEAFEKNLANYIGLKYAAGLGSGTDALTIACKVLDLKQRDGIIIPANVYPSAFGISRSGVKIQLADVDSKSLNINLENIQKVVDKTTKAILAVHLYGNPVNILPIKRFAKENDLYLIEDCAQAIGAEINNQKVGTFGDISCFSFYPTKNLGSYGDGGAILTNSQRYFQSAKLWRMYGEKERYKSKLIGFNSRLDEIQAAILNTKLLHLNKWNKKRQKIAKIYNKRLKKLPIKITEVIPNGKSVYHLFTVRSIFRNQLREFLTSKGIQTSIHYPVPIHFTKAFLTLAYKKGNFPVAEQSSNEILSLPMYPELPREEIDYVCDSIIYFFQKHVS